MSRTFEFTGVRGRDRIIAVWPFVAPLITRSIRAYHEHSLEEVFSSLLSRERQLWVSGEDGIESVLITRITNENGQKTCFLELCAGRGVESIRFLPRIETWAKEAGCSRMMLSGRKGWKRVLKDYRINKIILEKEI